LLNLRTEGSGTAEPPGAIWFHGYTSSTFRRLVGSGDTFCFFLPFSSFLFIFQDAPVGNLLG
jgi:hypothetical protein